MDKVWYKSKGVWGGLLIMIGAIYGYFMADTEGATVISGVGLGLLGLGVRTALDR